jgi:hypothetical protein
MASVASSQASEGVDGRWHARNRVLSVARIKPLAQSAIGGGLQDDRPSVLATSNKQIAYQMSSTERASSRFDLVLGPEASQQDVYDSLSEPILQAVQDGCNMAILTYGQTGAGKTYTLIGKEDGAEVGCVAAGAAAWLQCPPGRCAGGAAAWPLPRRAATFQRHWHPRMRPPPATRGAPGRHPTAGGPGAAAAARPVRAGRRQPRRWQGRRTVDLADGALPGRHHGHAGAS